MDFDYTTDNPLIAREDELRQRKAILTELARRAALGVGITPQPQGQIIGSGNQMRFVGPSAAERFVPLLQDAQKRKWEAGERQAVAAEEADLRKAVEAAANKAFEAGRDKEVPVSEAAGGVGPPATVKGDRVEMARQLSKLPGYQQLGQGILTDELVKGPERDEQRAFRAQEAAANRAQQAELARERIAQAAEAARLRSEDMRLSIQQRAEAAQQANALRLQLAQLIQSNKPNPNDKPLPPQVVNKLGELSADVEAANRFASTFKDDYAGLTGAVSRAVGTYSPIATENSRATSAWWNDYQAQKNKTRHDLFGAALTATEKDEWEKSDVNPSMEPAQIRKNLQRRAELEQKAYDKLEAAYKATGRGAQLEALRPQQGQPRGGTSWGPPQGWSVERE